MRKRQAGAAIPPVVSPYQEALDRLRRGDGEGPLLERMSELVSLLDITTTLSARLAGEATLDAALLIVTRELRVARGAFFVRGEDGWERRASRGLPPGAPTTLAVAAPRGGFMALGPGDEAHDRHGLVLLVPIDRRDRPIAVLGLGPREGGEAYGAEEQAFLRSVAACAAAPIENGLLDEQLRRVHQKLSRRAFELHNLFDLSRDLTESSAEEAISEPRHDHRDGSLRRLALRRIPRRTARTLPRPRTRAAARGSRAPRFHPRTRGGAREPHRPEGGGRAARWAAAPAAGAGSAGARRSPGRAGRGWKASWRSESARPGCRSRRRTGTSPRPSRARRWPRSRTPACNGSGRRSSARTASCRSPARSSTASSRRRRPRWRASTWPAESRPCYEVGGDSYDWIPLDGGRLALVIADVSGKGTPASLLMASVHAFVHALAGTASPPRSIERLNRFLLRAHAGEPVRHALLRGARRGNAPARLRQRRPRPALPTLPERDDDPPRRGRAGPGPHSRGVLRSGRGGTRAGRRGRHGHRRRDRGHVPRRTRVRRRPGLRGAAQVVGWERVRASWTVSSPRSTSGRAPRACGTT